MAALFAAVLAGCSSTGDGSPASEGRSFDASDLVEDGDGYSFRRVTGKGTELVVEQGFGEKALDEVVSVIAREGGQPVGPIDVMVLNETITPEDWVDRYYEDLERRDVSDDVGADAIVFTGSAIGVVMECRAEPRYVLIRGAGTHRDPLIELMGVLADRCSEG